MSISLQGFHCSHILIETRSSEGLTLQCCDNEMVDKKHSNEISVQIAEKQLRRAVFRKKVS